MKTKDQLIAFENEVAARFNAGKIRAPVHLYWGNEENIIKTLAGVRPQDWIFCSWRSHYQCLLKGVPEQEVMDEIMAGRSISLCFPQHRIYSSAIVGGVLLTLFLVFCKVFGFFCVKLGPLGNVKTH